MGHGIRNSASTPQKDKRKIDRFERAEKRTKLIQEKPEVLVSEVEVIEKNENVAEQQDSEQQQSQVDSTKHNDHVLNVHLHLKTQRLKAQLLLSRKTCIGLNEEIYKLKKENQTLKEELKKKRFSANNQSDESMKFYTG